MPKGIPRNGINRGWIKKGQKLSEETRKRMAETRRSNPELYESLMISNKSPSEEIRQGRRERMKGNQYVKGKRWAKTEYDLKAREIYNHQHRLWRKRLIEKLGKKCQVCGSLENLHAHHIVSVDDEPKRRCEDANGTILCAKHHKSAHKKAKAY